MANDPNNPYRPINTTDYEHPRDPNLNDLHSSMGYNDAGEPLIRTHVDGITLQGDVIVDKVKLWDGTNNLTFEQVTNDGESGQASIPSESYNMIFNGTNWDRMRGTINDGVLVELSNSSIAVTGTVALDTASLTALENINATVSGTVELGSTTLTALENINATVSGTVSIGSDGTVSLSADTLSALENITVSGTVELGTTTLTALENIGVTGTFWQATQPVSIATMPTTPVTGTFWQATQPVSGTVTIQDGGNTITVDGTVTANVTFPTTQQVNGTVELGTTTLTALENIGVTGTVTVQDGGGSITVDGNVTATVSGTVNIGTMPEVEIKNDTGNPIPISGTVNITQAEGDFTYVKYVDSTNMQLDMVERLRVSPPTQSWWYAPTVDKDGDLRYIESATGTGAGSLFIQNLSSISLGSGTDANGNMIRISRRRHKMRPGTSMLAAFSVNWNGADATGAVTKRAGVFTGFNGVFYEVTDDLYVVIRRRLADGTLVENRIKRTAFNIDRLDGTGNPVTNPSGNELTPGTEYEANITSYVSKTPVSTGGTTVYNVVYAVDDRSQFVPGRKFAVSGVTPTSFNGTCMVSSVSGATGAGNVTVTYITDPGSYSSLSSAKLTSTRFHNQYVMGFDFAGSRCSRCRFFVDGPIGRHVVHLEDFGGELSTPFSNAPAMSTRYEVFNSSAPSYRPSFLTTSEVINVEAELELNPGFGIAQRSTTLGISKGTRTEYALLGVGLRAGEPYQRADVQVQEIQIIDAGNVNTQNAGVYQWRLVLNPTFGGTAVPTPTDTGKATRQWNYNDGTTISGGITVTGGYVTSTQQIDVKNALNFLNLGSNIEYTDADKLVLAIKLLVDGTSDASLLASMNFIEAL